MYKGTSPHRVSWYKRKNYLEVVPKYKNKGTLMPVYDRSCLQCKTVFEVRCKIAEKLDTHHCPKCSCSLGEWTIGAAVVSTRPDRLMTANKDGGFSEVIAKIQERNKRTEISKR